SCTTVSTGVPSRQRANAGLDQNPVTSSIIFREGAPSRDPQVLIIALRRDALVTVGRVVTVRAAERDSEKYSAVCKDFEELPQERGVGGECCSRCGPQAQRWAQT
ncbi:hypothetical protein, partial [Nocardia farcinica]|uniref:hypothetical protein n=1 Tax=Nocardia farcinica TaxID=37329 RepID=UPI00245626EE